jgi:hypothetical protein
MKYWFLILLSIVACAPGLMFRLSPVTTTTAVEFIADFRPALQRLGITVESGVVQYYQSQGEPLVEITRAFYQEYPGFCPLRNAAFQRSSTRARFLTITANQQEIRLFAYEPEQQGVTYAIIKASAKEIMEVAPCPK